MSLSDFILPFTNVDLIVDYIVDNNLSSKNIASASIILKTPLTLYAIDNYFNGLYNFPVLPFQFLPGLLFAVPV